MIATGWRLFQASQSNESSCHLFSLPLLLCSIYSSHFLEACAIVFLEFLVHFAGVFPEVTFRLGVQRLLEPLNTSENAAAIHSMAGQLPSAGKHSGVLGETILLLSPGSGSWWVGQPLGHLHLVEVSVPVTLVGIELI